MKYVIKSLEKLKKKALNKFMLVKNCDYVYRIHIKIIKFIKVIELSLQNTSNFLINSKSLKKDLKHGFIYLF